MPAKALVYVTFAIGILVGPLYPAGAQDTSVSPDKDLAQSVASTLNSAKTLTADFSETDSYPAEYKDLKQVGTITLSKPNQFSVKARRYRRVNPESPWAPSGNDTLSVSDGSLYTFAFVHPHSIQYRSTQAGQSVIANPATAVPSLESFFDVKGKPSLPDQYGAVTNTSPQVWEGQTYQVVTYPAAERDADEDLTATAYIGSDSIIHRLIYAENTPRGIVTKEWQLQNVRLNRNVADSTFVYRAPVGAVPYDPSVVGPLLADGTQAPDFTVAASDGTAIKLSDFQGKTVILDFWATWCWPCNQSLPHTESVAEEFSGKNIVVLAVAIRDSKKSFGIWLKNHNYPAITFAVDDQPEGKDVASTLYNVTTTPTAYVIDPSGRIVRAIAGYAGPTTQLADAVKIAESESTTGNAPP